MTRILVVLIAAGVLGCGEDDDSNPISAPSDELVGSWTFRTSSDADQQAIALAFGYVLVFESDGSVTTSDVESTITGTWFVVEGALVMTFTHDGETIVSRTTFSIRDDTLTLVGISDGVVQSFERS